jgi:hypothetical protein
MPKNTTDDIFTKKHARLTRIALIANLFAWIVFIVHIFLVGARYVEVQNSYNLQTLNAGQIPDFMGMLKGNLLYAASFVIDLLSIFLLGVVYGLTLKGISVGLFMIVETNLNRKESAIELASDESTEITTEPVFYKPQEILWLEKWISRAAIAMIGYTVLVSLLEFPRMQKMALLYFPNNPDANFMAGIVASIIIAINILVASALVYFLLKALSSILKILMEMEFNSRTVAK